MQGWKNSNLTNNGIDNAIKLADRLKDVDFSHIYSSPLQRAIETAEYIRGNREIEIQTLESLKEMGFGLWEGLENEKLIELYKEEHYNYWNRPELYKPNGGETFKDFFIRIEKSLQYILENSKKGNILIVSHGIAIKALFSIINETSLEDFWEDTYVEGTSLSILEIKDKQMQFKLKGDTSHFK